MANISITLPYEQVKALNELAHRFGITVDDLIRISLDEMLAKPDARFEQAVQHVLNKNSALYRRLAD